MKMRKRKIVRYVVHQIVLVVTLLIAPNAQVFALGGGEWHRDFRASRGYHPSVPPPVVQNTADMHEQRSQQLSRITSLVGKIKPIATASHRIMPRSISQRLNDYKNRHIVQTVQQEIDWLFEGYSLGATSSADVASLHHALIQTMTLLAQSDDVRDVRLLSKLTTSCEKIANWRRVKYPRSAAHQHNIGETKLLLHALLREVTRTPINTCTQAYSENQDLRLLTALKLIRSAYSDPSFHEPSVRSITLYAGQHLASQDPWPDLLVDTTALISQWASKVKSPSTLPHPSRLSQLQQLEKLVKQHPASRLLTPTIYLN